MNSRVLGVLMWKHGVVRLRRYIHTLVDLFSPLFFFILVFSFKDDLNNEVPKSLRDRTIEPLADTDLIPISGRPPPSQILYYPDTVLAATLMDIVGAKLHLSKLSAFPSHRMRGFYPYSNTSQLDDYMTLMRKDEAIIIFENLEGESWPSQLKYTIRMKNDYYMDSGYESMDNVPGPHKTYGSGYYTFMRLQWAVDSSYMALVYPDNDIKQDIYLREFPYYNTPKQSAIKEVCWMLVWVCWLSLMLTFVFLMCRLLEERTSGIQELMKMVGVSLNTLGFSHFLNVLTPGLVFSVVATILLKISSNPLMPNSNGLLIFIMLLLYFNTVVGLAFACSYISKSNTYAASLAVLSYVVLFVPTRMLSSAKSVPYVATLASGFLPHAPMSWFWKEVGILEMHGIGLNFSNILFANHPYNGSVLLSYIFMLLQAAIYYLLAWYLSLVRPGKYGQALPWNFVFNKQYWNRNEVNPDSIDEEETPITHNGLFFEQAPPNMEVGIRIENVTKVYPKQVALRNVSLEVYKGEITVLVGHNGAGKTTLMSIITGMTSVSTGRVLVGGKDTLLQRDEVRQHLGLCPQHNLFFSDLTVKEHIMFFTLLKHGTFSDARISANKLAIQLGLEDKVDALTTQLSGGMKRRAQLACALAGGADVLVLDEPTSGLDVETRRGLWDLLLSLRGSRTVLLSTHFMEEADALGDRVAALHAGQLRCHATTMHLKKSIGTGYRLSFTTIGSPKDDAITSVVTFHVADAAIKEQTINSISYTLPADASGRFPKLFTNLEAKRSELGIDSIGVGVSTLEEVFLKLCSDVDYTMSEDEVDGAPASDLTTKRLTGFRLYLRQLSVLLKRQVKYALYRKWFFLILQVLLPMTMIILTTKYSNNENQASPPKPEPVSLAMFASRPSRVLYDVDDQVKIQDLKKQYPDVKFENTQDVAQSILRKGIADILDYNKYVVGVEINDTSATALYTTTIRHAAPVALNLMSNLLLSRLEPGGDSRTIAAHSYPLDNEFRVGEFAAQPKHIAIIISWGLSITFYIMVTNINCISLPCKERETGSRHIHLMSGCPAALHWFATLLFHMALCVVVLIVPTVISALVFDRDATINQPDALGAFVVVLVVGSLSFYAFMYLVSFNFGERTSSILLVASIIIFGILTPVMKTGREFFQDGGADGFWSYVLALCALLAPPHALVTSALQCLNVARLNAWCQLLSAQCPNVHINQFGFSSDKCCAHGGRCYFCIDDYSPASGIYIMIGQFVVYMTLVVLVQLGMFNGLLDRLMNLRYGGLADPNADQMVRAEREYVRKNIELPTNQIPEAMLVDDLHKNYVPLLPFKKSCNAVKGVSFSVKKGECFGLLGVNGAGKSTTFKMLTAEETATKGRIFGNGHHLKRGNSKYLQTLGYCPQFFGLDMFQTGLENLEMILTLRGLDKEWVEKEVKSWLNIVDLGKYARRVVDAYSGGCARRLGAAAALCGGSALALLDEPSAGVDVAARRRLWAALRRALRANRAVVITSHSMDEMEALCDRLAILSAGRVRALGTPASLRAQHAAGHAVVFKVHAHGAGDEVDAPKAINKLKEKLHKQFNCTLKDEHKTMLHYHINDTLRYSDLFTTLENLRNEFSFIEDYSVTETTLEEVFLSFAKEQNTEV